MDGPSLGLVVLGVVAVSLSLRTLMTGLPPLLPRIRADLGLSSVWLGVLTTLPGIGRWTAEAYLLACLDRPDVWPVGDRALQVAVGERLGLAAVPDQRELEVIGERWRPHRSTAARLLWHGYLVRRGRRETVIDLRPDVSG